MSLQDSLSEIHFTDIVRQCEWSRIVDIRSRACGWFRGCSLGQRNFTEVCNNIDKYATALSTLCTALVAEAAVNESSETNTSAPQHTGQFAFCWKSMCDGQDYVSMSLHFENYMAQLLAFCLHMNGATSAHIKSLRMWENEHVKCETRDAAEAFVIQWQTDDVALRATMMKEFHYAVDAARRARKALEEWSTLRAYTGLRYPPELSREFAERLEHLTLFWAHHLFVETNSAGMYTISYNDEMQWTSPLSTLAIDAPAMVAMLRWQNAAASTFYLLLDHPMLEPYMATLLAIADWSLRGALYQRAYALMEEGKLAMALSAMWALEARDWSEPQAMTPLAATIEPLIKYLRSRITPREMSRAHDPDELARAFVDLYDQPSQYYQDFLST